jgi:hypothetical protein
MKISKCKNIKPAPPVFFMPGINEVSSFILNLPLIER